METKSERRSTCAKPLTLNNPIFLHIWHRNQVGQGYSLELRIRSKMVHTSGNKKILQSGIIISVLLEKTRLRDGVAHEGMALLPSV